MHEMALAEGILSVVLDAAGDVKVRNIELQVGELQLVVAKSLRFSFKRASQGTLAQGAAIHIQDTPARMRCSRCGTEGVLRLPPFQCEQCSSTDTVVIVGDEVVVDAVELEDGHLVYRREVPAVENLEPHFG